MRCVFGPKFWKILSVTPIWRWEKRFEEGFRNYVLTLPNGHEKCVWAKKSETFSSFFCSHFPLEARCPSGPLFGRFFSSLTWGKCQPPLFHYPLEEKRLFERKKWTAIQIFFSLIYLDRNRGFGRKFWIFFWFHSLPEAWCRSGPLFGKFFPSANKPKTRISPQKQKSLCHFWHRDAGRGIKNPPQENSCGGYYSVAVQLSIFSLSQKTVLFRLDFCDYNNNTFSYSCQFQVSFTLVSTFAILIITHYLCHVSVRLVTP